jgi:hypothetical protein
MTVIEAAINPNGKVDLAPSATAQINIQRIGRETMRVPVIGTAPLIVHAWSEKAKRQMLDAMQSRKTPKTNKDPEQDCLDALYTCEDGRYGVPSLAFKSSFVNASRYFGKATPMTLLRQALFVEGVLSNARSGAVALTPIVGSWSMREDPVRVGVSGTDLRYRPEFREWGAIVIVTYVSSLLSQDSVLALIDAAGMGVGVCEWRPERNGANGTYRIDESRDIEIVQNRA